VTGKLSSPAIGTIIVVYTVPGKTWNRSLYVQIKFEPIFCPGNWYSKSVLTDQAQVSSIPIEIDRLSLKIILFVF
jgi:hypothetical protein